MSFTDYFERTKKVFDFLAESPPEHLNRFVNTMLTSWKKDGKVISFGNGGSAADSLHFTTELTARFKKQAIHKPAISLVSNSSTITAVSNDWSYEEVFARQLKALGYASDVVLGISTSGNSENVLRGLKQAKKIGASVFGLTGQSGGKMSSLEIPLIQVPTDETAHIQEAHIACLHSICEKIDRKLNSISNGNHDSNSD